ncbi:MAG TPA: SurA N-terminal domain-containing protein [Abditibacteriaceae bacterium]|jgi:tetratricopeptide (TPR) repeat protein
MADKETINRRAERTAKGTSASETERPVNNRMADHADEISDTPLSMTNIRHKLLHGVAAKVVLGLLIFIFAIAGALFSGLGGPPEGAGPRNTNPEETIAMQGDDAITRGRYQLMLGQQLQQMEQFGQKTGPLEFFGMAQQTLTTMATDAATVQAGLAAGINPTDADVDKEIERLIKEQIDSQKTPDPAAFRRQIEAKYPNGEADLREELLKNFDRELVRRSLVSKQYEEKIKAENKVSEDDYKRSVTKLQLRQIVIRPELPGPKATDFKKAQEENAAKSLKKAEELAASFKGKSGPALTQAFAQAARTQSADTATKSAGGVLGLKLPTDLTVGTAVRDALLAAKGNLVGPVVDESSKDAYIFLIENRKLELPKDYAKKKTELLKNFETQRDTEVWNKKQEEIRKAAKPEISDPALAAYRMQIEQYSTATEAEKGPLRETILTQYQSALGNAVPLEAAAINYQMAQLYRDQKQTDKALAALQAAVKAQPAPQLQLELARALREAKRNKEALTVLKEASKSLDDSPSTPSMFGGGNPDDAVRFQIASEYDLLNDKAAAAAERKKVKPAAPQPMGGMPGMGGPNSPISIQPGR